MQERRCGNTSGNAVWDGINRSIPVNSDIFFERAEENLAVRVVDQSVDVHTSRNEITHESSAATLLEASAFKIRTLEDRLIGG